MQQKINKQPNQKNVYHKLLLASLITILFVTIRIVIDICSFIPTINNSWSNITWTITAAMLLIFNTVAIVFTYFKYKIVDNQHKVLVLFILIVLCFTITTEIIWFIIDIISLAGTNSWNSIDLINELRVITIIGIACDLVVIPTDVISTYLTNKSIKHN